MTIYKDYDQQQLDAQYNTRLQVPDYAAYFERWERLSRQTDQECKLIADVPYGPGRLERVDVFPAEKPDAKTMVFIHGGYWHLLDKSLFHFLAAPFVNGNVTTVVINYPLAPTSSIDEIVRSCKKAIAWVYHNIQNFNGDPSEIYITGHSAGGHLAGMLMTDQTNNFLKGIISLSGLFRLEPVMHSYVNEVLAIDLETATRNSPVLLRPTHSYPLLLVTGGDESEEFKAQSLELYQQWNGKASIGLELSPPGNIEYLEVNGKNHYSILDGLIEEGSSLEAAVLRLMDC